MKHALAVKHPGRATTRSSVANQRQARFSQARECPVISRPILSVPEGTLDGDSIQLARLACYAFRFGLSVRIYIVTVSAWPGFFRWPTAHDQREEHYYCFDSCVLGGIVHHLALVPVEISLEAVGQSKRI